MRRDGVKELAWSYDNLRISTNAGPCCDREGVGLAVVNLLAVGRHHPCPEPLRDDRLAADGLRTPYRQHPVQDHHAEGSLRLLGREAASTQPRSDQRLVTSPRRLDQRASAIGYSDLPGQSPLFRDRR